MVFFLYQSLRPAPSKRPCRSLDPSYGPACTAATNRQCLSYSIYPWQRIVAPFDFVHSKCADEYLEQIQSMHCKSKWMIFVKLLFPIYPFSFNKLTDKWAIRRANTTEWCTRTIWKCMFSHWRCSVAKCKVNRAFVSIRTHRTYGKYI